MNDGGRDSKAGAGPVREAAKPAGETGSVGLKPASHWFSSSGERVASEQPSARFARMQEERQQIGHDLQRRSGSVQLQRGAAASVGAKGFEGEIAAGGVSGAGARLPHADAIQKSFGRHDVSGVQAHTGGDAKAAAGALGARAFATGQSVAFADGAPSLHTAAHEAAHVVQQRAGVAPSGLGPAGGEHERHADEVADRVVAGKSSEKILDRMAGPTPRAAASSGGAVQLMPIRGSAKDSTVMTFQDINALDLGGLSAVERGAIRTRLNQLLAAASSAEYQGAIRAKLALLDGYDAAAAPRLPPPPAHLGNNNNAQPQQQQQQQQQPQQQQPAPMQLSGQAAPAQNAGPRLQDFRMAPDAGEVETIVEAVNLIGSAGNEARNPKTDGNAYVANIPTVGAGKDRTVGEVANQYLHEAFATPDDAADRFGMVVGVNRMESIAEDAKAPATEVSNQAMHALMFSGYKLAALGMVWRPHWLNAQGQRGTPTDVRNALAQTPADDRRAYEAQQRRDASPIPVGRIRDLILRSSYSAKFATDLQKKYQRAFIHVADSDAITLNVGAPLFNRYDQVVNDHRAAHGGQAPAVASGGYDFVRNGPQENDQRKTRNQQTVDTNQLDMGVRQATARVNPAIPYPPEPNMIVDVSRIGQGANFSGARGPEQGKTGEATNLVNSMGVQPNQMAFDRRATIQTDAGRFDAEYTNAGMLPDQRSAAQLVHPGNAAQSHARQRQLAGRIESVYGLSKAKGLYALLGCMLPQGLFDLTGSADAAPRMTLEQAREHLARFGATAGRLVQLLGQVAALQNKKALDQAAADIERDVDGLIAECRLPAGVKPKILDAIAGVNLMRRGQPKSGIRRKVAPVGLDALREIIVIAGQAGAAIAEFLSTYQEATGVQAPAQAWTVPNPMMVAEVMAMPAEQPVVDDAAMPPAQPQQQQQQQPQQHGNGGGAMEISPTVSHKPDGY